MTSFHERVSVRVMNVGMWLDADEGMSAKADSVTL
jgi:hypothetical protein